MKKIPDKLYLQLPLSDVDQIYGGGYIDLKVSTERIFSSDIEYVLRSKEVSSKCNTLLSCRTCSYYKKDVCSRCDGICLFSKTDNGIMESDDDISANDPYLCVSEDFFCNQYKAA